MKTTNKKTKNIISHLLSWLFPRRCAFCGKAVDDDGFACTECLDKLPFVTGELCSVCGREKRYCCCSPKKAYGFERCISPLYYEDDARRGVIAFKFRKRENNAAAFASLAAEKIKKEYASITFDAVTSVPLSHTEKRRRGYNQAEVFARKTAKLIGVPYRELLKKPSDIKLQRELDPESRWQNVKGAFKAENAGGTVLLADDIITTGATLDCCARELLKAGAQKVYCVTVACTRMRNRKLSRKINT